MIPKASVRSDERGAALVMSIVLTAVCLVITVGLMEYVVSDYRASHVDWRRVQALYCAEAGVEKAVELLRTAPGTTSVAETPLSTDVPGAEGTYEVTMAPVSGDPNHSVRIIATGYVPSKSASNVRRTVLAVYSDSIWDFGTDAVRARQGVRYASNEWMTVVVDDNYNVVNDTSVDASVRVTGTGATIGAVDSIAANKARVAGKVSAPGWVDVPPANARGVSENDPRNYISNAFPPASDLGKFDGYGNLIVPPTGNTWAASYYNEALAGGTIYHPSGTITGSKYIDLGGYGWLRNVTLIGPGTVFVNGNLGGGVTNGSPPVTLVVSGDFFTSGGEVYRANPDPNTNEPPTVITFGRNCEIRGTSTWYLNGPLLALNPHNITNINDSAITCFGAIISNGWVAFQSSKGAVGYPRRLQNTTFTARGPASIISYSAR